MLKGFKFYRQPRNTFLSVFPFRPMTLFSSYQSAAQEMSYFYRPHTSKKQRPIVFIHGIGIGSKYSPSETDCPSEDKKRGATRGLREI